MLELLSVSMDVVAFAASITTLTLLRYFYVALKVFRYCSTARVSEPMRTADIPMSLAEAYCIYFAYIGSIFFLYYSTGWIAEYMLSW